MRSFGPQPHGGSVLTLDNRDRRRLDVYSTSDAKHVTGWRPYAKEQSDDDKAVVWADFLTSNQVLTVNRTGLLVLWSLPDCKAVYVAEGACDGSARAEPRPQVPGRLSGRNPPASRPGDRRSEGRSTDRRPRG